MLLSENTAIVLHLLIMTSLICREVSKFSSLNTASESVFFSKRLPL